MHENYSRALRLLLADEGGYVNHPADPGGATNKGVTQRVYDAYRQRRGLEVRSVRQIEMREVEQIYDEQYAKAIRFDELPAGVDYAVFDGAVNSGPRQAAKWLQQAAGVRADGVIGNVTLQAVAAVNDVEGLIDRMCDLRLAFMRRLKTWKTFGRGWKRRVEDVRRHAKEMAVGFTVSPVSLFGGEAATGKAMLDDVAMPPAPTGTPTVGAGVGGAGLALESLRREIEPYAGQWDFLDRMLLALVILSGLIAVGTFGYGWWASWKRRRVARDLALDIDVGAADVR